MLETAIILPTILAFLFGSIDIANYFRSYNAVKEGVSAGLRCLYPTDAACMTVNVPKTVLLNDYYIPPIFSPYFNYDGMESKLMLPDYEYGPLQAQVLSSVNYKVNRMQYSLQKMGFNAHGDVKVLAVEFPIMHNSPNGARFASIEGKGMFLPYSTNGLSEHRIGCNALYGKSGFSPEIRKEEEVYGSIHFTIPPLPERVRNESRLREIEDCVVHFRGDPENAHAKRSKCTADDMRSYARLFFKLDGQMESSSSSIKGVGGHLDLFLEYSTNNGTTWNAASRTNDASIVKRDLGGQEFNRDNADFYPRGFTALEAETISTDLSFEPHGNLYVPWGSKARIRMRLRRSELPNVSCPNDQYIGWNLTKADIRIALPEVISEAVGCKEMMTRSECVEKKGCSPIAPQNAIALQSHSKKVFDLQCNVERAEVLKNIDDPRCFDIAPSVKDIAGTRLSSEEKLEDYRMVSIESSTCGSASATSVCPDNYGVTDIATEDKKGTMTIRNSLSAQSICPAQNAVPGSEEWSEKIITVDAERIKHNAANCTFDPDIPLELSNVSNEAARYKKLLLPTAQRSGESQLDTSNIDPEILKRERIYECPAARVEKRYFQEESRDQFGKEEWERMQSSAFYGSQRQLGCQQENVLKAQAIHVGMSEKSFFFVTKSSPVTDSEYQTSLTSVDSCMKTRMDTSLISSNLRRKLPGGPYAEDEIPQRCMEASSDGERKNICMALPAGVKKLESSGSYEVNQGLAAAVATETVKSFLPSIKARPLCKDVLDKDCLVITIDDPAAKGEDALLTTPFSMRITVQQPLLILGNKPIPVSFSASREWEGR